MTDIVTADTLHRTAKYFMDTGRAATHAQAMGILHEFGLRIEVGPEVETSRDHQIALLTLVNAARRTFLGGIHVTGALLSRCLYHLLMLNRLRVLCKLSAGKRAETIAANGRSH